jgi:O-antigen/teichoic acid export membrane protein
VVWAGPLVDLALGPGYGESAEVLRALAPFVFLSAIGTFITVAVNYLGEARRRVPLAIATVALNAALDVVLLPWVGVIGAAVATDIAFLVYVAGHMWICKRLLDLELRPLGVSLVRCLVAAGSMAGVLALFGTTSLSALEWAAGSAAGLAVYVAMLVVTGEVSRGELAQIRSLSGRLTGGSQTR